MASCPFAPWTHRSGRDENPSFAVSIDPKRPQFYNCFSCHAKGLLATIILDLKALGAAAYYGDRFTAFAHALSENILTASPYSAHVPRKRSETYLFSEDTLARLCTWNKAVDAAQYLRGRQVSHYVRRFLDLRWDDKERRIIFPIRDAHQHLVGLHGRAIDPDNQPTYKVYLHDGHHNYHIWYGEAWVDITKPVLIVESVFDLASVLRVYPNSICSLSCGIGREKLKRLENLANIVTMYDHGTGGDAARKAISRALPNTRLKHLIPTESQDDPGSMSVLELKELIGTNLPIC